MLKVRARKLLWRVGNLLWKLHPGQRKLDLTLRNAKGAVVVFNVSRQWGKTYFAVLKAIELALKSKSRIRYATAFESDLVEFVLPAFEAILEDCPEHLRPKYHVQRKRFTFANGSEIKLVGLDRKPNGLRGNTIDFIILDEAGFISRLDYLHTSVIVPLITHRPKAKILVISTPPETPDHPFWDFVDRAILEGAYACFTIDENPMLTPDDIGRIEREMGGRHTTAFRREYLCQRIIEASRAIIPEWDDSHIQEPFIDEFYPYYQKYEALDLGVKRDLTLNLYSHYDFKLRTLFVHDETAIKGPELNTRILAGLIKEKELLLWSDPKKPGTLYPVHLRVSDNNNPLLVQDLAQLHNLPFVETSKDKLHEMVNLVKIWVSEGRVKVSPQCKQLIGCLRSGIWTIKRDKFDHSKVFGHFDALAALVYLIRNIDDSYNPIPHHHGKNRYTHFLELDPPPLSNTAKSIKRALLKK